jgi:hypothetical protein
VPRGSAALIATGLLTVLVVRADRTYLVAGLVAPALLERVAADLAGARMITTRDLTKRTAARSRSTVSTSRCARATGTGCWARTAPARPRWSDAARPGVRHPWRDRDPGRPVPRRVTEVLPSIGALVEGPGAYPHLSGGPT